MVTIWHYCNEPITTIYMAKNKVTLVYFMEADFVKDIQWCII